MKGGLNPGQPDFRSRYNSQANRSQGRLYAGQGSCLTNGVAGGLGSETKPKAKVRWTHCRGQPDMRDKSTIKGRAP